MDLFGTEFLIAEVLSVFDRKGAIAPSENENSLDYTWDQVACSTYENKLFVPPNRSSIFDIQDVEKMATLLCT